MQFKLLSLEAIILGSNVRVIDPNEPEQIDITASIRQNGILVPGLVLPPVEGRHTLFDGNRRFLAAKTLGLKEFPVIVTEKHLSESQIKLAQLTTAIHRKDLSGFEKWNACTEILCANASWDQKKLAEHLGLSEASISKLLSPSKLSAEWQDALKAGRATISDCYRAATAPEGQRAGLLALKLSGATGEVLAKAARKPTAKPHTTVTVKLSRVKLPLPDGAVVVVSAPGEVDTQGLLEVIDAAREAVKKADKEQLDVKTLAKVMEDKAKASSSK